MDKLTLAVNGTPIKAPEGIPTSIPLGNLEKLLIETALTFGIIISLFYLMYGGFYWLQSKGDKEKLDKARRIILYSIFGLVVMSLSLVTVSFITSALGVQSLVGNNP